MYKIAYKRLVLMLLIFVTVAVLSSDLVEFSTGIKIKHDAEGIPMVCYGIQMGRHIGCHYYPLTVAAEAKSQLNAYHVTGAEKYLDGFNLRLDWLLEHRSIEGNATFWRSDFEWPATSCEPGWPSAMTQGVALTDLAGAYYVTGNETYLEIAESVMNSYYVHMDEGGILYEDSEGVWYAEYPCGEKPTMVLNGYIYALEGLHDYHAVSNNSRAKQLFDRGTARLESTLMYYDTGSWTTYDLNGNLASPLYHGLHIQLMGEMHAITGNGLYLEYQEKWAGYTK